MQISSSPAASRHATNGQSPSRHRLQNVRPAPGPGCQPRAQQSAVGRREQTCGIRRTPPRPRPRKLRDEQRVQKAEDVALRTRLPAGIWSNRQSQTGDDISAIITHIARSLFKYSYRSGSVPGWENGPWNIRPVAVAAPSPPCGNFAVGLRLLFVIDQSPVASWVDAGRGRRWLRWFRNVPRASRRSLWRSLRAAPPLQVPEPAFTAVVSRPPFWSPRASAPLLQSPTPPDCSRGDTNRDHRYPADPSTDGGGSSLLSSGSSLVPMISSTQKWIPTPCWSCYPRLARPGLPRNGPGSAGGDTTSDLGCIC